MRAVGTKITDSNKHTDDNNNDYEFKGLNKHTRASSEYGVGHIVGHIGNNTNAGMSYDGTATILLTTMLNDPKSSLNIYYTLLAPCAGKWCYKDRQDVNTK